MENNAARIKEYFVSLQGEGPYVGYKQLFIRFCKCNLTCSYCDTDFTPDKSSKDYTPKELAEEIKKLNLINLHAISLTGGEPLLETDFLKEFIPLTGEKIYLETNGTLPDKLKEIIKIVDYISMDIKLASSTKTDVKVEQYTEFIDIALKNNKKIFLKIVFDENITQKEIEECVKLAQNNHLEIVLQPVMLGTKIKVDSKKMLEIFNDFNEKYDKVRLVPQLHKFMNIE